MTVSVDGVLAEMVSIVVFVTPRLQKGRNAMATTTNVFPAIVTVDFVV